MANLVYVCTPSQWSLSANDDRLRAEQSGSLVELPSRDVFRLTGDDAHNHVRHPARVRAIVFGRRGGMIRMTVVNADEIEVLLPRVIVRVKQLERVDRVPPSPVLRLGISPARFGSQIPGTRAVSRCLTPSMP